MTTARPSDWQKLADWQELADGQELAAWQELAERPGRYSVTRQASKTPAVTA